MLTNKQYAAVLVVDIDQPGEAGGHPINLHEDVRQTFLSLTERNIGPAWVGINPQSGKAQAIWLIDPVYANQSGNSPAMSLLAATSRTLGELLDHDPHFAHRFSRSPFYTGDSPTAYRWYRQHNRVNRLGDLIQEVRSMTGQRHHEKSRQKFSSGRELINAVRTRREEAQAFKSIAKDVENELASSLDQYDPDLIDGVRVLWVSQGRAARDETAFRHALKNAHRLRQSGQRMTDAAIIDAYEYAYLVAHSVGSAGRPNEMPPMRDRQTMARRVRGYATQSHQTSKTLSTASGSTTTSERKALATMGRRGGKKAAERWKDRDSSYAQAEIQKLQIANQKRAVSRRVNARQIANYFDDCFIQTGKYPTIAEAMQEFGVSRATVNRALKAAGIMLPRGRRKQAN
ncbi:replication initiation protein [Corynebacterium sp. H128]|uniref:replication initiation protein n=1 Tax=unclassified Corynebacterium TaxID=2624378 RepID=UPI0030991D03